jgi:hypothetical protein
MGIAGAARTLTALVACAGLAGVSALPAGAETPLYGLTVDRIPHPVSKLTHALAALPRRPTTRVYFEVDAPASAYLSALEQIHPVSAVMGELLDSSDERSISTEAFQARTQSYLQTLSGDVDIWEVGNEVNGNWTGPYETVAAKLTEAYEDVAAAHGVSALTLYANQFGPDHCGDGEAELTPLEFSERYVPPAVADGLDYVLLSYYPSECGGRKPSAAEVAVAMEALHALYPDAALGFGEVGLPHPASARTKREAEAIMSWAYSLEPGEAGGLGALPYYIGGYFWWYGWEDALKPHAHLAAALPAAFEDEAAALEG